MDTSPFAEVAEVDASGNLMPHCIATVILMTGTLRRQLTIMHVVATDPKTVQMKAIPARVIFFGGGCKN